MVQNIPKGSLHLEYSWLKVNDTLPLLRYRHPLYVPITSPSGSQAAPHSGCTPHPQGTHIRPFWLCGWQANSKVCRTPSRASCFTIQGDPTPRRHLPAPGIPELLRLGGRIKRIAVHPTELQLEHRPNHRSLAWQHWFIYVGLMNHQQTRWTTYLLKWPRRLKCLARLAWAVLANTSLKASILTRLGQTSPQSVVWCPESSRLRKPTVCPPPQKNNNSTNKSTCRIAQAVP